MRIIIEQGDICTYLGSARPAQDKIDSTGYSEDIQRRCRRERGGWIARVLHWELKCGVVGGHDRTKLARVRPRGSGRDTL